MERKKEVTEIFTQKSKEYDIIYRNQYASGFVRQNDQFK